MKCKHDLLKVASRNPYKEWEFCKKCDYDSREISESGPSTYTVTLEVDFTSDEIAVRSSINEIPMFVNRIAGVIATRIVPIEE